MSVLGFSVPHTEKYWLVSKPRQRDKDKLWYCKSGSFDVSRQAWEQKKNPPFFHLFLYQWHLEALPRVFCCRMIIRKSVSLLKHIEAFNEPRRTVDLPQSLNDSKGFHGEVIQRDESKIICIYPSVHSQQCKPCAGAAGLADTTKCCQWASLCWNLSIIDLKPVRITINTKNPSEWFVCLGFFCPFVVQMYNHRLYGGCS